MLSMTGFGSGRAQDGALAIEVQIASVNHRGCQVQLRGDLRDLALEELVRAEVRAALGRGSITVQVQLHSAQALPFDLARLAASWRELSRLAAELGAPPPALEQLAALGGAGFAAERKPGEGALRAALAQAVAAMLGERKREGAALAAHLRALAAELGALMPALAAAAAARLARYREGLAGRLREVLQGTGGAAAVTPELLVRELALYSERIDVAEELVRLAAHLAALDGLLAHGDEAIGRKLEFLLQECAREANTVCAKANDSALTALALNGKGLIEQLREQSANIA
jgi:uncharacterized protein YicC (UPF0701 family)